MASVALLAVEAAHSPSPFTRKVRKTSKTPQRGPTGRSAGVVGDQLQVDLIDGLTTFGRESEQQHRPHEQECAE